MWKFYVLSPLILRVELDVLRHDGHPLWMDRTEIGVLKQANEVGLSGFLQGGNSGALELEIGLEVLSDFSHQTLKGELPDQQFRALLVLSDLPSCHHPRPEAVARLHASY
ncbi:hypothetical protein AAC387_Pa11g1241 [Persea americana]